MRNIKIGCNWSEALHELLEDGLDIDYIKAGEQTNFLDILPNMLKYRNVLLHGGLGKSIRLGNADGLIDYHQLNQILKVCGTSQYGIHIAFTNDEMSLFDSGMSFDLEIARRIRAFAGQISVPLLLENTPECYVEKKIYKFYPVSHPDNIAKIIYSNDVGFLLDITHAKITAFYNGWNIKEYLSCLPLDRVREIHTNGWGFKNGRVMDKHSAMEAEDYRLLDWTLERTNPTIVSLEYSGVSGEENFDVKQNICKFIKYMAG